MKDGRVDPAALTAALETESLQKRFETETALRKALAIEAKIIAENLNTELLEGEKKRLAQQKLLYMRYMDDLKQQALSLDNAIFLAEIGDPSNLSGSALQTYHDESDRQAGESAMAAATRSGITDDAQLESIISNREHCSISINSIK